jgi:hypothetical protein
MKNFAFGDYLTGAWAATGEPEWADATTPKVDEDSFATADTTYDTAFNPAHTATWGITDFLPLRDQVAIMNQSCGLVSWFSRKGTYFVGLAPRAWSLPSVTDTITEVQDIFQGSFQVDDFPSGRELINTVPYSYGKRYHGPGEAWAVTNAISQASGAILTAQRQTAVLTPGLDLHMIRDATTAGLVAALLVSSEVRTSVIRVKSGLFWLQRDLMQLFQLTHGSGSGANGYAAEKVTWMHESVDLDNDVIEMVLEDTFAT